MLQRKRARDSEAGPLDMLWHPRNHHSWYFLHPQLAQSCPTESFSIRVWGAADVFGARACGARADVVGLFARAAAPVNPSFVLGSPASLLWAVRRMVLCRFHLGVLFHDPRT